MILMILIVFDSSYFHPIPVFFRQNKFLHGTSLILRSSSSTSIFIIIKLYWKLLYENQFY